MFFTLISCSWLNSFWFSTPLWRVVIYLVAYIGPYFITWSDTHYLWTFACQQYWNKIAAWHRVNELFMASWGWRLNLCWMFWYTYYFQLSCHTMVQWHKYVVNHVFAGVCIVLSWITWATVTLSGRCRCWPRSQPDNRHLDLHPLSIKKSHALNSDRQR